MEEIRIVRSAPEYADSFNAAVDRVARERKYIGFVEGPPLESTRHFMQLFVDGLGIQMLAVTPTDTVVEVFASNVPAIALYQTLGFVTEGTKRRARKLDGEYDDNIVMALLA